MSNHYLYKEIFFLIYVIFTDDENKTIIISIGGYSNCILSNALLNNLRKGPEE